MKPNLPKTIRDLVTYEFVLPQFMALFALIHWEIIEISTAVNNTRVVILAGSQAAFVLATSKTILKIHTFR